MFYLFLSYLFLSLYLTLQGGSHNSKAKRAKCSTHKQKVVVTLYNKVCDIVSNMSELLEIQLLTDTTILQVRFWIWVDVIKVHDIIDSKTCNISDFFCHPRLGVQSWYYTVFRGECQWTATVCHHTCDSSKLILVVLEVNCAIASDYLCLWQIIAILWFSELHFILPQVFSRYEKHRQLILEEIFTSLARLPTSKRSLRNFR